MTPLARSLAQAARIFWRSPGLAAAAIATLTVGIAAPTAMFSLATGILGELPFDQPDELVEVEQDDLRDGRTNIGITLSDLAAWREAQTSFEDLAAVDRRVFQVGGPGPRPVRLRGAAVSPRAFELLGVSPIAGRGLTEADAAPGGSPVVLLSYEVWEDRYALDPEVIRKTVRVDGEARTVVGVMREGFEFPRNELVWIPLVDRPGTDTARVSVFGRLRDGVSPEAAQVEFDVIAGNLAAALPETHRDLTISIHTFAHAELGDGEAELMLYSMTLVLSFILVVACVNVAHLLLARAIDRSRQIAVRMALGAGRARVLGGVLGESLLLSVAGGAGGVGLAYGTVAWLDARLAPVISLFWATIEVDTAVLVFVGVLVILSSLMTGILPARQAISTQLLAAMKEGREATRGVRAGRTTRGLVGVQIAFSCGLLILSGLMVKGVVGLATRDLAFRPDGVFTAHVELREFDYPDADRRLAFVDDVASELRGGAGVEGVVFASGLPGLGSPARSIELEAAGGGPPPEVGLLAVTPDFFPTFRTELVAGRLFTDPGDGGRGPRLAVVTDIFAERLVPDGRAVGRRFRLVEAGDGVEPGDWIEIVGVVRDGGVFAEGAVARPGVFVSLAQAVPASLSIALRTSDPASAAALLRDAVGTRNPDLPLYRMSTLRDAILDANIVQRTFGTLFAAFGLIALLMAVVGLYAVVAYGVKRRTHEIGMRRALGSPSQKIVLLMLRGVLVPLAGGLATGTGLALIIAPAFGAALFGVSPRDPAVVLPVVAVLSAATLIAGLVPAFEATRIDPMRALRVE